jgi:hypothetical protein
MKKVIFFFINPPQISILSNNIITTENLPDLNNYFVISHGYKAKHNSINPVNFEILDNEVVIIVKDNFDITRILNNLKNYKLNNSLEVYAVFHHNKGNAGALSTTFLNELGTNFKSSLTEHEVMESAYGRFLIPLIKKFSTSLFNELISIIPDPLLEEKLILLHECLTPSSVPKELSSILLNAAKGIDYQLAFNTFLKTREGKKDENAFDSDYIDALTKLRIALLGS